MCILSEHCLCWWPGTWMIGARTSTATVITCSLSLNTDGLALPSARTPAVALLLWYFAIPTGGLALLDVRASEAIKAFKFVYLGTVTAIGLVRLGNQSIYSFISYICLAMYMLMAWHHEMPRYQLLQSRHSLRIIVKLGFVQRLVLSKHGGGYWTLITQMGLTWLHWPTPSQWACVSHQLIDMSRFRIWRQTFMTLAACLHASLLDDFVQFWM